MTHPERFALMLLAVVAASGVACVGVASSDPSGTTAPTGDTATPGGSSRGTGAARGDSASAPPPTIFVVMMENQDASTVFSATNAPYINGTILPNAAIATTFIDELPSDPSEPHYIWMEAGTNAFDDHTFDTDADPSATNSTGTTAHLLTQIAATGGWVDWMSYQEGTDGTECPIAGAGVYVPRHDPSLFFQDIVGSPPSRNNAFCTAHHRPLDRLAADLASGTVAPYVLLTPNLCHDMHGSSMCPSGNIVSQGDDWLAGALPPLVAYVTAHDGVIFIVWDEGSSTTKLPFIALGTRIKRGYSSTITVNHGSLLKTVEDLFHLPTLPTVANVSDLSDLFVPGAYP